MDETRKRLLFRATHRGMQETDRLIGGFAKSSIEQLDHGQLVLFEALLEESDGDLLDWISGRKPLPAAVDNQVMDMIIDFRKGL